MINSGLIERFKEDPSNTTLELIKAINQKFAEFNEHVINAEELQDSIVEIYCLIVEAIESGLIISETNTYFEFSEDTLNNCQALYEIISEIGQQQKHVINRNKIEMLRNKFRLEISNGFCYEFSAGDLERIQKLVNEIRGKIADSDMLEENHKERLLARLERLQRELHKKTSDLDRFWGLTGDAIVILRKFGEDSKPIVDRVREIAEIVWRTQERAEELPSGSAPPMLEDGE